MYLQHQAEDIFNDYFCECSVASQGSEVVSVNDRFSIFNRFYLDVSVRVVADFYYLWFFVVFSYFSDFEGSDTVFNFDVVDGICLGIIVSVESQLTRV